MKPLFAFTSKRPSAKSRLILLAVLFGVSISLGIVAQTINKGPDVNVTVVGFQPAGRTDRETNITVQFSSDMVPRDSLDRVVAAPPLEFDPPIPGLARWIETNTLRFYPDDPLSPATSYTARVVPRGTYIGGNRIKEAQTFFFETRPITVGTPTWRTEPAPEFPGKTRLFVDLTFNYQVNIDQLTSMLTLAGVGDDAPSRLSFTLENMWGTSTDAAGDRFAQGVTVVTEPFATSDKKQVFRLKIEKDLTCYLCENALPDPFEVPITIEGRQPLVVSEMNAYTETRQGLIRIYFSTVVLADSVEKYVALSPKVAYSVETQYNSVILRGDFHPGETYAVTVDPNLVSSEGSRLGREFSSKVTIPDYPPSINFSSPGVYLPKNGSGLLEVTTINVDKMTVEIDQIFANNIVFSLAGGYGQTGRYSAGNVAAVGRRFFGKTIDLAGNLNEDFYTTIDVAGIIGDSVRGIFKVAARNEEQRWEYDSRLVMITDIGIIARMSGNCLMVWAHSLADLSPVKNAAVTLYSINNQELVSGKTDSRGLAIFENIGDKIKGFDPYVITVSRDNDLSYLMFDQAKLETSTFDVAGRPYLEKGYEAFLYSDRGVYRPGDTAHLVSVVRGRKVAEPPQFPYAVTVYDPSGRKFEDYRLSTESSGPQDLTLEIPDFAPTGKYRAEAHIGEDYVIGRLEFQVEDFLPDRIKVTVSTDRETYAVGDTVGIDVAAKYLFGPPAANLRVSGHVTIEERTFSPRRWSDHVFTDSDRKFTRTNINLKDSQLDDSRLYAYRFAIPVTLTPPSALSGLLGVDISEPGGRAVSGYREISINPYRRYIGLKYDFEGYAKPGQQIGGHLVAVDPDARAVAADSVRVRLYRLVYHTILRQDSQGRYHYVSEQMSQLIDSLLTSIPDTGVVVHFTPSDYGAYRVVAEDLTGGHRTASDFYVSGWGYAPWAMEQPDRIEINLDKKMYAPGEQAAVQVRAPFGGKLLVTVEKETVMDILAFDMDSNTAEFNIDVKKDFAPNAYITATVVRKASDIDKNSPARAYGVAPIMLANPDKALNVSISAPDVIKPDSRLTVTVKTDAGNAARITVAGVDAGILQLTDFKTPDPLQFFYGKKALGLVPYDIYSYIYPEIRKAASHLSPAGERMLEAARVRHLNPITARRVKPVALWSGVLTTDQNGVADVEFTVPQFNGTLTLMAVTVQGDRFGSASKDVTVRDNIVLQENFPRFVSPGDLVDGLITVFNHTGARATITVNLEADGPVAITSPASSSFTLADNAEADVIFNLRAGLVPGPTKFVASASEGSERSEISYELSNRPALPLVTRFGSGTIASNDSAHFTLPDEWLAGTDEYVIRTSSLAAVELTRQIDFLMGYPYGCLEQTTSKLFPLLYFSDLARFARPDLVGSRGPEYFVQEGILKLTGMMRPDGMFLFWPDGQAANYWANVYASHFLLEADKAGFSVDRKVLDQIADNVKDIAEGKRADADIPSRVYAAYALARTGKLERKTVNYIRSLTTDNLPVYTRYQVAGVLVAAADTAAARLLIPTDIQPALFDPEVGGNYSSGVRTNAILLQVLSQIDPQSPSAAVLVRSLMETAHAGRWYTTQETAFALMAVGEYFRSMAVPDFAGVLRIQNDTAFAFDTASSRITRKGLGGRQVSVSIKGSGPCFYYWQASGVPVSQAIEEFSRGIRVTREYLDDAGNRLDLQSVPLGSQVIAHIRIEAVDQKLTNVVVSDLLPAAFEIENPRLKTTPRLRWIPDRQTAVDHQDIRDDRLLLFLSLDPKHPVDFYYSLRAVAAGTFTIPPVSAECMYNPLVAGSGSSGILSVTSRLR